jgi:hypothetical protein
LKVKQLIKKLQGLDPDAEVVVAETTFKVFPVRYAHPGVFLKKEKIFVLQDWIESGNPKYLTTVYGQDTTTMKPNAVMLANWTGRLGDD